MRLVFNRRLISAATFAVMLVLAAAPAHAQEVATSFDELRMRVAAGDEVSVTDITGLVRKGRIAELTPTSLMLHPSAGNPPFAISPERVNNIAVRRSDRLWNGMLIGFLVGAVPGLLIDVAVANEYQTFSPAGTATLGLMGLGIGTLVDVLHKTTRTIFVQPAVR